MRRAKAKQKKSQTVPPGDDSAPEQAASADDVMTDTVETDAAATAPAELAGEEAVTAAEPDLQALLDEANEKFLRAKAEHDNYRKRVQREFAEIREAVKLLTLQEFLTVFDHFQMAVMHAEQDSDLDTLKQGMTMIGNEFKRTLEGLGVSFIDAVGQPFNPDEHDAVAQQPSEDVPEGHVLQQWKCGFRVGARLLRPASVVVSSGPPGEEPDSDPAPDQDA